MSETTVSAGRDRAWHADGAGISVPVCKPRLPSADRLIPYLRRIDATRWYTNNGPLSRSFETRLAEHLEATSSDHVVVAGNATAALTATLLALDRAPGSLCMMPAWTFAASAHAVVQAGLVPWFVDVDARDGMLSPNSALRLAAGAPQALGAVLAISGFGLPVDIEGWAAFRRATGVPVVLDAAAAFDSVRVSAIPTVVSLHATKAFGIGEGAFVTAADAAFANAVRCRINFGFSGSREATVPAMNAKLSEYGAAVGLAALDEWPATRDAYRRVAHDYLAGFRDVAAIRMQRGYGTEWISATAIVETPADRLARVEDALADAGIGTRRWWGDGLARQRAFARYASGPLHQTELLAATTLGLPCWTDLSRDTIARVTQIVSACVSER